MMPSYKVELLRPMMVSVELEAASDDEAYWIALEAFRDDLKNAPLRVTEIEGDA